MSSSTSGFGYHVTWAGQWPFTCVWEQRRCYVGALYRTFRWAGEACI